jgi:catechol 2,3-dioxygenase-like lactoylglutathione lyase family enzyme
MFTASMPNLYSSDVAAAASFYRGLLGFSQTYRYPPDGAPRHVELRLGSSLLAISSLEAVVEMGLPPTRSGHDHELVVWCDDMDAAIAQLRAAGAPILIEPHTHVAGHRRAYVADPDGHWLALVQE